MTNQIVISYQTHNTTKHNKKTFDTLKLVYNALHVIKEQQNEGGRR